MKSCAAGTTGSALQGVVNFTALALQVAAWKLQLVRIVMQLPLVADVSLVI